MNGHVGFSAPIEDVTTGTGAWKVVGEFTAGANHRAVIRRWLIDGKGTAVDVPIKFRWIKSNHDGTGGSTTITINKTNPHDPETLQIAGARAYVTADPTTSGNATHLFACSPIESRDYILPLAEPMTIPGGESWMLQCYMAGTAVNICATPFGDE